MSLFTDTKLEEQEEFAERELLRAFETSHKRHLVTDGDEDLITSSDESGLSAVNTNARVCWAKHLCRGISQSLGYDATIGQIADRAFFVTLVDIRCATGVGTEKIDLAAIKRRFRRGLRGYNYIGVIEPALYCNITLIDTNLDRQRCISWHLHALVFGISLGEKRQLVRRLRESNDYIPITPAQTGVDVRKIIEGRFAGLVGYILKPPTHSYRIGINRYHEQNTGEILHKQYRTRLRPGERITLYLQMRHLTSCEMWIAGGDSRQIRSRAKRDALSELRRIM